MKLFISALVIALSSFGFAQEPTKIAVMDLQAKAGIDRMKTSTLTDVLCTHISNQGNYEVIGRDDMKAMLEHLADKQLLECDDTKCLAKVGGALGVDLLLSGNIGMLGETYVINLKLIDIGNARVLKRISEKYMGGEAGLIDKLEVCVKSLFGIKKEPVAKVEEKKPERKINWLRYGLLAAGLVSSGVSYYMYDKSGDIYRDEYKPAGSMAEADIQWDRLRDYENKSAIFIGLGGACLLGGGITFAF